jgi:hypothetical protein
VKIFSPGSYHPGFVSKPVLRRHRLQPPNPVTVTRGRRKFPVPLCLWCLRGSPFLSASIVPRFRPLLDKGVLFLAIRRVLSGGPSKPRRLPCPKSCLALDLRFWPERPEKRKTRLSGSKLAPRLWHPFGKCFAYHRLQKPSRAICGRYCPLRLSNDSMFVTRHAFDSLIMRTQHPKITGRSRNTSARIGHPARRCRIATVILSEPPATEESRDE